MDHLSHFLSTKNLSTILVGRFIFFISVFFTTSHASVIQFFDPTSTFKNQTIKIKYKVFLANDPVSVKDFLNDWHGDYNPNSNRNFALLDSRFDIGRNIKNSYYLGYFYQYNLFINTNKDFTDLFYAIKNKRPFKRDKNFILDLDIVSIKQNGLLFSGNKNIFEDNTHVFTIGGAFYLSYGFDMQDGVINGNAKAIDKKDYDIDASSSYYYTHNYLYSLDINPAHGYGYGSHVGVNYENKKHHLKIKLLINDLVSKMYWKNLPYSKILLSTKNKNYDKDGYVKYRPTISGLEQQKDYIQTLTPRYKLQSAISVKNTTYLGGIDSVYREFFPYIKILHQLDKTKSLEIMYEKRFNSFGVEYSYKTFKIGILTDKFSNFSSFGLSSSFIFRF